jgi:hypothetical protein
VTDPFAILNALPEGAILVDGAGAVIFANTAARQLLGAAEFDQAPGWDWTSGPDTFRHEDRVFEIRRSVLDGDPPATLLLYRDVSSQREPLKYASLLWKDIRVSVSAARSAINVLLSIFGGALSEEQRHMMDITACNLMNALERIEFLRRWIIADVGNMTLSRAWINITEVIREAAEPFMLPHQDTQAPLELPSAELWLAADCNWMRYVFSALLEVSYFQFRGRAPRRIAAHQEAAEAVITINVAMNASLWPRVGSARRVIGLHGGTLTVTYSADQGTIFTIRLPVDALA